MKPFCFVLMPFGTKFGIDFDAVYTRIIKPAIIDAELEPIRADEEVEGGLIHKPMFERLMLSDYAVADLSTANANVFYELGIRHGARPHRTILMFGEGTRLPFDVAPLRALPYRIGEAGELLDPEADRAALATRLKDCKKPVEDSPLFQLVGDWPRPDISRLKTDRLRELVDYSREMKARLAEARSKGAEAVVAVGDGIDLDHEDPAILIDLFLSHRAVKAWEAMVDLAGRLPDVVAGTVLVQEQLGFALNRLGRRDEAEQVLKAVIARQGPSSETNGLLGRIYKDRWQEARDAGKATLAEGFLRKAIETYVEGFETDWRDAYPGINAVTLMEMSDDSVDPRQAELLPVVRYAVKRRLEGRTADYWDQATLLELAVLAGDAGAAATALGDALALIREPWEPETTVRNLRLVHERRGCRDPWLAEIIEALDDASRGN